LVTTPELEGLGSLERAFAEGNLDSSTSVQHDRDYLTRVGHRNNLPSNLRDDNVREFRLTELRRGSLSTTLHLE